MTFAARRGMFVRMFSSALGSQTLLSATSFGVALLLIRRSGDLQFGHFILVSGIILLACSLQYAFIAPAMINRMTKLSRLESGDLTGGLYREQRRVIIGTTGAALAITLLLWMAQALDVHTVLLVLAAIAATAAALRREYFRMVLLAYRRANEVMRGDFVYCALLVLGVMLATLSPAPAAAAALSLCFAALIAGLLLSRTLHRHETWNAQGSPGILREIAPTGTWSTAGAAIHWCFSQGYTYLIAAILDVRAVAAVAAVRLLAMPVNLLSTGIGSLMLPLTSRWLHEIGAPPVLRRLFWFALTIAAVSLFYFTVLWFLRDWVFEVVLKQQFAQRDLLLALWAATFVMMSVNQQFMYLLIARERFRPLTSLALVSTVLALAGSYWGMLRFGGAGAVLGILIGELIRAVGIAMLCLRETMPNPDGLSQPAATTHATPTRFMNTGTVDSSSMTHPAMESHDPPEAANARAGR